VVVNLPFDDYITSLAVCFSIYLAVFTTLWIAMRIGGTNLKGME